MSFSVSELLLCFLVIPVVSYFCGCINGAILISRFIFKDDVRTHGSGNAGLTNFYRNYGGTYAVFVIVVDMLKMVLAVVIAGLILGWSAEVKVWAGVWCVVGHMFPVTYNFKGGKGILSSGALLFLLDWRVALVSWGIFILLVVLTRYISLGSVTCSAAAPVSMLIFYPGRWLAFVLVLVLAGLVIWAHRSNIVRLVKGTENKFRWKK